MRATSDPQLWLSLYPVPDSQERREYEKISEFLYAHPECLTWVREDQTRGVDPDKGRNALTAEQGLRALIIQGQTRHSYKKLTFHLNDSMTFRWFCRLPSTQTVSCSALHRAIKPIRPETIEKINRVVLGYASNAGIESARKVRTDCTVVASNIHKPTDSWLLWDVVRVLARLLTSIRVQLPQVSAKNHTRVAKRRALRIVNAKNKQQRDEPYRDLIAFSEKTVGYARNALEVSAKSKNPQATVLAAQIRHFVELGEKVIDQTRRRVIDEESVPASEKIVSIFEPHTDIIRKDRRETLYGHKICLTAGKSGLVLDCQILDGNPADSTLAVDMVKRIEEIYGRPPRQVTFDGGFSSISNLQEIKEIGVGDVAFSKARGIDVEDMVKSPWVYKQLRNFRAGIEGIISFLKRSFGLGRCAWRSLSSFKSYVWSSILSANLVVTARRMLQQE